MGKGIYFGGRAILKPGVYATTDATALVPRRLGPANTIGIIGIAEGGQPRTVTPINSPQESKAQLRAGVMRDAIDLMYDPSPQIQGAGEIKFYRHGGHGRNFYVGANTNSGASRCYPSTPHPAEARQR